MDKRSYIIQKDKMTNNSIIFEYDKVEGYQINPKAKKKDQIEVSKIIFVNDTMSEKIIRKKIDKKIELLLKQLKLIEETDDTDPEGIKRSLMDAEKLRLQLINNYVKYLGHTYQSLTLKKIQIIINQLKYKLYLEREKEMKKIYLNEMFNKNYDNEPVKEGRKGR